VTQVFKLVRPVEFNHCDPAGIVFYPRYFEMISAVTERFLADDVGYGWAEMMREHRHGTPLGEISARFHAPSRLADVLEFSLTIDQLGRSSAKLLIECYCGREHRFSCIATVVYINLDTGKAAPWPDAPRAKMQTYLAAASAHSS
jgi:4-hydroxybenzoyl-CoA thioesterase